MNEILDKYKDFDLVLGGSLALIKNGIDLGRKPSDIDFIHCGEDDFDINWVCVPGAQNAVLDMGNGGRRIICDGTYICFKKVDAKEYFQHSIIDGVRVQNLDLCINSKKEYAESSFNYEKHQKDLLKIKSQI